ncbi:phosphatidylinositol-3,4,5-tris phosphate 3-phosphatase Pten, partial [Acrasis kona]
MNNILRTLVSKKKNRFKEDGFDLDLTYISDRIIAMGYPSVGAEQFYRNPLSEVRRFFDKYHRDNYMIYNLCSEPERTYDPYAFEGNVLRFPFDDHNPPPLSLFMPFCQSVDKYLAADPKNVVGIHCKAGKGRTGTMIVAYMLYCGLYKTVKEAALAYGATRTKNGQGITINSQLRSLFDFQHCVEKGFIFPKSDHILRLKSVLLYTTPHFDRDRGCSPYFIIEKRRMEYLELVCEQVFNSSNRFKPRQFVNTHKIIFEDINLVVDGDLRIKFFDQDSFMRGTKMFQFTLNTNFVDLDTLTLIVNRTQLDGMASKDVKGRFFDPDFYVELKFELIAKGLRHSLADVVKSDPSRFGKISPFSQEEVSSEEDCEEIPEKHKNT